MQWLFCPIRKKIEQTLAKPLKLYYYITVTFNNCLSLFKSKALKLNTIIHKNKMQSLYSKNLSKDDRFSQYKQMIAYEGGTT